MERQFIKPCTVEIIMRGFRLRSICMTVNDRKHILYTCSRTREHIHFNICIRWIHKGPNVFSIGKHDCVWNYLYHQCWLQYLWRESKLYSFQIYVKTRILCGRGWGWGSFSSVNYGMFFLLLMPTHGDGLELRGFDPMFHNSLIMTETDIRCFYNSTNLIVNKHCRPNLSYFFFWII